MAAATHFTSWRRRVQLDFTAVSSTALLPAVRNKIVTKLDLPGHSAFHTGTLGELRSLTRIAIDALLEVSGD
jgi:hypothetical protein